MIAKLGESLLESGFWRSLMVGVLLIALSSGGRAIAGTHPRPAKVVSAVSANAYQTLPQRLVNGSEFGIPVVFSRTQAEDIVSVQSDDLKHVESIVPIDLVVDLVTEMHNSFQMRVIGRSGQDVLSIRLAKHLAQIHCLGRVDRLSNHQYEVLQRAISGAAVVLAYRPVSPGAGGDCRSETQGLESSRILFVRSEGSAYKVHLDDGAEPVIQRLGRLKI